MLCLAQIKRIVRILQDIIRYNYCSDQIGDAALVITEGTSHGISGEVALYGLV